MSLHIRFIQGSQAATEFALDRQKRFFRVGRAPDCELVLTQLGLPDVACFFECDFVQKTASVHSLCQEMLVLNGKTLKQNEQVQWGVGQELRIGPNCCLFLESLNTGDSTSVVSRQKASKTPQTTTTSRKIDFTPDTGAMRQGDAVKSPPPRPQQRHKKTEPLEPVQRQVLPDFNEAAAAEIAKKRSQMLQIAMIAACAVVIIVMLFIDTKPRPPINERITFEQIMGLIDDEINVNSRSESDLKPIQERLRQAKAKSTSSSTDAFLEYRDAKNEVLRLLDKNQFSNQELLLAILKYANQQLQNSKQ